MNADPLTVLKRKHTCKTRFGTENPMSLAEIREKQKQTCIQRLGVDNASKSKEIQAKKQKTCEERFNSKTFFSSKQFKEAKQKYLDDHDVVNVSQIPEIYHKVKQTHDIKYGGIGYASDELRRKSYDTNKDLHGDEHYSNLNKAKQTMKQKFGVEWYTQTNEYHKNKKHKFSSDEYPGVTFDSTWEIKVYDFLSKHNISFEYQINPIPFNYDGSIHYYHPDFKVNGKIYEVKGDNFFRINEETGKEEMYCTWRNPEWTDEYYEWRCGLEEAKHQCMIANNVIILRHSQIKNLTIEMFA